MVSLQSLDPSKRQALLRVLVTERQRRADLDRLKREFAEPGGLVKFIKHFWHVLEPETPFVEGWALEAVCEHLEAVTDGDVTRLLITVPPGFMKSLTTDVFWPAWEWGARNLPHLRYVAFSYAASLTERDNGKFRDLVISAEYQEMYGDRVQLRKVGERKVTNAKHGSKLASSVGGVGTGERGNRVILDDPHNIKEAESEVVRTETVRWVREAMSNRLNDMQTDAIIVIMQRSHEDDVAGALIAADLGYCHLMIPMEYEPQRHCETLIGWSDPRTKPEALAWPERFPRGIVTALKGTVGSYAYSGQYQQSPVPRGGGIFKRDWWQLYPKQGEPFHHETGKPLNPLVYPPMDYVVVSVDTAYTEKEENDWSACTVWGSWRDENDLPRLMLMDAWQERIQFRSLVERIIVTCKDAKADRLLIEAKANGISVGQEIGRLMRGSDFGVSLIDPKGDKVARAYSVVNLFESGLVYAPDRRWADMVIDQMSSFPKGAHDDLVDAVVTALKHMRDIGVALLKDERDEDMQRRYGLKAAKEARGRLPYAV